MNTVYLKRNLDGGQESYKENGTVSIRSKVII